MKMRFAPMAGAVTAILLLGACSDDDADSATTTTESSTTTTEAPADGATTLATGVDVELVGDVGLGGQTLNVSAQDEGGEVTGEIGLTGPAGDEVIAVECADTDTDGVVILAGTITASDAYSGLAALFIREGDPDSVAIWYDEGDNTSCTNLLGNRHDVLDDESLFVDVEAGSDIET